MGPQHSATAAGCKFRFAGAGLVVKRLVQQLSEQRHQSLARFSQSDDAMMFQITETAFLAGTRPAGPTAADRLSRLHAAPPRRHGEGRGRTRRRDRRRRRGWRHRRLGTGLAGVRVLVLEAGPRYDPVADYRLHRPDWELHALPHAESPPRRPRHGYAPNCRSWSPAGTTCARGMPCSARRSQPQRPAPRRLPPCARRRRLDAALHRRSAPPAPAGHADEQRASASPPTGRSTTPNSNPSTRRPSGSIGVAGRPTTAQRRRSRPIRCRRIRCPGPAGSRHDGGRVLGWGWEPNTLAVLSRPYDGRPGCNYCLQCNRGCPRGDKGSVDVTFLRAAVATGNCTFRWGCRSRAC